MADFTHINLNAPAPDVMPWGKYTGRSVAEVQQTDPGYLQWLIAQSGFREKHVTLYQIILNGGVVPNETPEHNYYQALFLDEKFAVFDARLPGERERSFIQQMQYNFGDKSKGIIAQHPTKLFPVVVEFEASAGFAKRGPPTDVQLASNGLLVRIEIKPAMSDDYPAVLRQMKGSRSDTLYLVNYTGEGATLDQVKKIFKASGIVILMHADFAK